MINIPKNICEEAIGLYQSGFRYCDRLVKQNNLPIAEAVDETVKRFGSIISIFDNLESFKNFLFAEVTAYTEPSIGVIDPDLDDKNWWSELNQDENFKSEYWERYHEYVMRKPNWSIVEIDDINKSTDEVMNALSNPRRGTPCERMGMVFGYVQSGKTAHYIGIINKAFDAGYRIIIVLSGIHNALRCQTQTRIDEEVLGYQTSSDGDWFSATKRNEIGVGVGFHNSVESFLQSITTQDENGDFSKKTGGVSMYPPFLMVTKKNATVMRKILTFFHKHHCAEVIDGKKKIPAKYPALVIDDEADQASINTKESYDDEGNILSDYNPSTINGLIRELLGVFECCSYIGYTATPFANIFIPPKIDDEKYGTDLFPRDFIYRAPRSDKYIGAREFFGLGGKEDSPVMPLYRRVIDGEYFLQKKKGVKNVGLPEDLKLAVKCFLLSIALRNCRGQTNTPNTMLVHVVRYVSDQNRLKTMLSKYFKEEICNYIRYGEKSIQDELEQIWINDYIPTSKKLHSQFSKYMSDCDDVSWDRIWLEVQRIINNESIITYSINGQSRDVLLYKEYKGKPFNVIVIGGDKLSRGFTLEGLSVSYFTRTSNTYDTLMQMCRWFGFRHGYLDACRLFTTQNLREKFAYISMATEDLAEQFDFMNSVVQTPKDFGLRVASHPSLQITSRNKMRTGQVFTQDFSCKLSQTRVFDIDGEEYDRNFTAVEDLLFRIKNCRVTAQQYKEKLHRESPAKHIFYFNVSAHDVVAFFESYETSKSASRANSKYMADYVRTMNSDGLGGVKSWTVCLINVDCGEKYFDIADLKNVGGGITRQEGSGVDSYERTCSIHSMVSNEHEYFDYSKDLYDKVVLLREVYKNDSEQKKVNELIRKSTRPFQNGLLLLYPIASAGELTNKQVSHKTPFGFAVVFPDRQGKGDLKSYRVNDIAIEKNNDEFYS